MLPAAVLVKTRRRVAHGGLVFAVDEFEGTLRGLVLAEIELPDAGTGRSRLAGRAPARGGAAPWLGREVTSDDRYSGAALARHGAARRWRTGG